MRLLLNAVIQNKKKLFPNVEACTISWQNFDDIFSAQEQTLCIKTNSVKKWILAISAFLLKRFGRDVTNADVD